LHRLATEGGSYQVRVSFTPMCMWAQEIGLLDGSALTGAMPFGDIPKHTEIPVTTVTGPFGEII
jgi:hypothetical protein